MNGQPAKRGTARAALGVIVLGTTACLGCGGTYDAQVAGQVTLDGKPLERGVVAYYPAAGGPVGFGVIEQDGHYDVVIGREAGLPPGDYAVTVVANEPSTVSLTGSGPPPPGRRLTPQHVSDKATTDLHFTVEPGGNTIDLALSSP